MRKSAGPLEIANPSWDPKASVGMRALAVSGSTLYAGGRFIGIGGRYHVAALDAASGARLMARAR